MDKKQQDENKRYFQELCHKYIKREGLEGLLSYLDRSDFYDAPSSTAFHLNEPGGLCQHSINVCETALKLNSAIVKPAVAEKRGNLTKELSTESIAIATLFHDLCKINFYKPSERWKKDENGRWVSIPGYKVEDSFPLGHGEKSLMRVSFYLKLEEDEMLAIRWHMGMFDMAESGSSMMYSFRTALEKYPLVALVHSADFLSSNLLEKTTPVK